MILISEFGFVQLDNLLVFSCIILVPLRYFVVWFRIWVYWVGGTIPGFQWVYICKLVDYNLLPIPPVTRWWQLKYVLCSPLTLGKRFPFWLAYISDWLLQPPNRWDKLPQALGVNRRTWEWEWNLYAFRMSLELPTWRCMPREMVVLRDFPCMDLCFWCFC